MTGAPLSPIAAIIADAAAITGILQGRITGRTQDQIVVRIRGAIIWTAVEVHGPTLAEMGHALGKRDHTTISAALRRANSLRDTNPEFAGLTEQLRSLALARFHAAQGDRL